MDNITNEMHYSALGLNEGASGHQVKEAFRKIVKIEYSQFKKKKNIDQNYDFEKALNAYMVLTGKTYAATELKRYLEEYAKYVKEVIDAEKNKAALSMLKGIVFLVLGIGFTAYTYSNATSNGGRYTVFYGAIGVGAVMAIISFATYFDIIHNAPFIESQTWDNAKL